MNTDTLKVGQKVKMVFCRKHARSFVSRFDGTTGIVKGFSTNTGMNTLEISAIKLPQQVKRMPGDSLYFPLAGKNWEVEILNTDWDDEENL